MIFLKSFFCPAVRCLAHRSVLCDSLNLSFVQQLDVLPSDQCYDSLNLSFVQQLDVLPTDQCYDSLNLYIYIFFFSSSSEMFCPQVNVMTAQSLVVFCPFTRSPTSPMITFHREGFGRQSMSEKRKGHMDPRTSEVYQRAKASKDQKDNKGKLQLPASLSKYVFLTLFLK